MINTLEQPTHVFIDETGGLSGSEPSNAFYVCTAIIVENEHEEELNNAIRQICLQKRQGATLKSSAVGTRHKLRLDLLRELCKLPFSFLALVTDKRRLDEGTGLRYKKSRYKFLHGRLNRVLKSSFRPMELVIDEHGTEEFQNECIRYFEKNNERTLFSGVSVRYSRDEDEPILQLADFIGGSLLSCFDPTRKSDTSGLFREEIRKREAGVHFFPIGKMEEPGMPSFQDRPDAEKLRRFLNNTVYDFLETNASATDETIKMQVFTLVRLHGASQYEEAKDRCIFSEVLIKELSDEGFQVTKRSFTGEVIGGLRRAGIIISGTSDGYKLALTQNDISEYLDHDRTIIIPMLDKLIRAKESVLVGMNFDILQGEQHGELSCLVEALKDRKLDEYGKGPEPDVEHISMIEQ